MHDVNVRMKDVNQRLQNEMSESQMQITIVNVRRQKNELLQNAMSEFQMKVKQ